MFKIKESRIIPQRQYLTENVCFGNFVREKWVIRVFWCLTFYVVYVYWMNVKQEVSIFMRLQHPHEHYLVSSKRFSHIPFSLSSCHRYCFRWCRSRCRSRERIYHNRLGCELVQFCLQANKVAVSCKYVSEKRKKKKTVVTTKPSWIKSDQITQCYVQSNSECVSREWVECMPCYCYNCCRMLFIWRVWAFRFFRFFVPSDEAEKSNNRIE